MIRFKGNDIKCFDELYLVAPAAVRQKLDDNKVLKENPLYHPEDNAFEHIKIVTNRLFETKDINMVLTGFFHDICKAETAIPRENSPYFLCRDHEKHAVAFALRHVNFIHSFEDVDLGKILWIIDNHMRIKQIADMRGYKKTEILENTWFESLVAFSKADKMTQEWDFMSPGLFKL